MPSRSRKALAAAATVVASLLLALAVSEGIARLLLDPPRYHREPVALDPELGFAGIPNMAYRVSLEHGTHDFALNRDGLRGRELPDGPAPEGVERIAFLGDSFLVAELLPEEDLVTARLEAALAEQGRAVEVYNLSAVDWGTGQQLLYLDRVGEQLAPDVVILAFFQGNDVVNNSLALANATGTSPGDPIRPYVVPEADGLRVDYVDPTSAWLRRHSRIFATLERRLRPFTSAGSGPNRRERVQMGRMPLEELEIFRRHAQSERWEQAWQDTFALLDALQARCDALGARLVVLSIPTVHQVLQTAEAVRFAAEARAYARRPLRSLLDWNEPDRRLASYFRTTGVEGVMLLEALRDAATRSEEVYAADAHLGSAGHAVLAEAALNALARPVPKADPATGEPLPLPLDPERFRFLDFAGQSHDERVAAGWLLWNEEAEQRPWGWAIGPAAMLALEYARGALLLRGFVDPRVSLPVDVTLKLIGAPSLTARVERAGAFQLRFEKVPKPALSESGHAALLVATEPAGGFHVEAVGFETGGR
jgi:hypothetical protein